jgi:hypothetical protein
MERRMGIDRLRIVEEASTGDGWDSAKAERELKRRKIVPISPAFRIVVLANPPTLKQGTHNVTACALRHATATHARDYPRCELVNVGGDHSVSFPPSGLQRCGFPRSEGQHIANIL